MHNIRQHVPVIIVYILLIAGGLWNILGLFTELMTAMATPLIIGLNIAIAWYAYTAYVKQENMNQMRFFAWSLAVIVLSMAVEGYGVASGLLFGTYGYGDTLTLQIAGVPLAIGFAWLGTALASVSIAQRFIPERRRANRWMTPLTATVLMVLFDLLMEPAAMALGYWDWAEGIVPMQNYIMWFVLGLAFTMAGEALALFKRPIPEFALHAYAAQIIYFFMSSQLA
ncbi:MAG: hypothetical protein CL946_11200 [Ectothiorhodospiraceae bacterium]|nr:hypothetical protein [Ectothiorhodospiraceae bacterium]